MKHCCIILFCLSFYTFSQGSVLLFDKNPTGYILVQDIVLKDSIQVRDTTKQQSKWYEPHWKKHNHIVDFVWTTGVFSFDSNDGALGYRYLYNTSWKYSIKFGSRFGIWGRKSRGDLLEIYHKKYINYSLAIIVNFPVWKLFSIEYSPGFSSEVFWPQKTNTINSKGLHSGATYFYQKIGVNTIILSHISFDFGIQIIQNIESLTVFENVYIGLGYKF